MKIASKTSALTARAGIEVMARMSILLLLTMFGFIIAVLLMAIPYYLPYFQNASFVASTAP